VLSLCIFPAVVKPLLREIFGLPEEICREILEERKRLVPQFIIQALKAYEPQDAKKF
jgi:hypothetical protein